MNRARRPNRRKAEAANRALEVARRAAKAARDELAADGEPFGSLFEHSPVSLWKQDYSQVRIAVDEIVRSGGIDLRGHFRAHPGLAAELGALIQVVDVNQATVELYGARSKEEILGNLGVILGEASEYILAEHLTALAEGALEFELETVLYRLHGETARCLVSGSITPGSEESWSQVLVSVVEISKSKEPGPLRQWFTRT
jgi:PAS domain-containing protein